MLHFMTHKIKALFYLASLKEFSFSWEDQRVKECYAGKYNTEKGNNICSIVRWYGVNIYYKQENKLSYLAS